MINFNPEASNTKQNMYQLTGTPIEEQYNLNQQYDAPDPYADKDGITQ